MNVWAYVDALSDILGMLIVFPRRIRVIFLEFLKVAFDFFHYRSLLLVWGFEVVTKLILLLVLLLVLLRRKFVLIPKNMVVRSLSNNVT